MIPADAIGIYSHDNDNPLEFQHDEAAYRLFSIVEQSESTLRLRPQTVSTIHTPVYLGGIVSQDRETIYWVNTSRPLP